MPITVNHSTPADGSFSASGATAWNANHSLVGVGTMAEQNANNVAITGGSISGVSGIGTVTAVTGTAPVVSSGGNTPAISMAAATGSVNGYLTATDWTTFNNKLSTAVTSATAGTGMSVSASTGPVTFTNTAPDQVVALTAGTGISIAGTYPNFSVTNTSPSLGGDVVGPTGATDNAIARYDTTTGKLLQNSLVIIGDTGSVTGVNALTAESLTVNNNATLGSSNTDSLDVRARISSDLDPETNNAKDIGSSGRNWRDAFFGRTLHTVNLELTGTTSFDGSQGTSGQVLTSAGTGNTPTWATPTTGTVTSVSGTGTVSGISLSGTVTSSGNLTLGGALDLSSPPAIGAIAANAGSFTSLNATSGIGGGAF